MRKDVRKLPSQEELLRRFSYNPEIGEVRWNAMVGMRGIPGTIAGHKQKTSGYWVLMVDWRTYYAQRIIWKMMTGSDPEEQIDHIDGDRMNNRWSNLRMATNGQNKANGGLYKNNKSGYRGVCWDDHHNAWTVQVNRRRIGRFKALGDAVIARDRAALRIQGEFAKLNLV